jgi:hypothetical protein
VYHLVRTFTFPDVEAIEPILRDGFIEDAYIDGLAVLEDQTRDVGPLEPGRLSPSIRSELLAASTRSLLQRKAYQLSDNLLENGERASSIKEGQMQPASLVDAVSSEYLARSFRDKTVDMSSTIRSFSSRELQLRAGTLHSLQNEAMDRDVLRMVGANFPLRQITTTLDVAPQLTDEAVRRLMRRFSAQDYQALASVARTYLPSNECIPFFPEIDKSVFTAVNSKGQLYFLHSKDVTLKGGRLQRLYFFARDVRDGAVDALPAGYVVLENPRTGLLVIAKG